MKPLYFLQNKKHSASWTSHQYLFLTTHIRLFLLPLFPYPNICLLCPPHVSSPLYFQFLLFQSQYLHLLLLRSFPADPSDLSLLLFTQHTLIQVNPPDSETHSSAPWLLMSPFYIWSQFGIFAAYKIRLLPRPAGQGSSVCNLMPCSHHNFPKHSPSNSYALANLNIGHSPCIASNIHFFLLLSGILFLFFSCTCSQLSWLSSNAPSMKPLLFQLCRKQLSSLPHYLYFTICTSLIALLFTSHTICLFTTCLFV